jgi:nucleoside-diphosphate-sugar epimerase
VRALVRNPERAAWLRSMPEVEIFPGDLSRPESLAGCAKGCSLAYHCAAQLTTLDWKKARRVNISGTRALLEEAERAGVEHLVYTSTIGVYGPCQAETITEETPWSSYHQAYFDTKQEAERIVSKFTERLPLTIARLGDVVGPGQHIWTVDLIEKLNRGLLNPPLDSESGFLNPLYIDNLLDALLLIGGQPACGQVYNVVDGTPIRSSDYFRRLAQLAGKRIRAVPAVLLKAATVLLVGVEILAGREVTAIPGSIDYLLRRGRIYPDKIHASLGWSPAVPEEDAFERTGQWLRQAGYIGNP